MQEQTQRFCKAGITSGFVGESQKDPAVRWKVLNGLLDLVYISPENICNPQYRDMLLTPEYKERLILTFYVAHPPLRFLMYNDKDSKIRTNKHQPFFTWQ